MSAGAAVADAAAVELVLFVPLVEDAVVELLVDDLLLVLELFVPVVVVEAVFFEVELGRETAVAVLCSPETPIIVCAVPAGIENVPSPV